MRYGLGSKTKQGIRAEHCAVAVEFAIVLSVLLLLVFGIIDFGHAYYMRHMMSDASREGARYATRYQTGGGNNRILPKKLSPTLANYVLQTYGLTSLLHSDAAPHAENRAPSPWSSLASRTGRFLASSPPQGGP